MAAIKCEKLEISRCFKCWDLDEPAKMNFITHYSKKTVLKEIFLVYEWNLWEEHEFALLLCWIATSSKGAGGIYWIK